MRPTRLARLSRRHTDQCSRADIPVGSDVGSPARSAGPGSARQGPRTKPPAARRRRGSLDRPSHPTETAARPAPTRNRPQPVVGSSLVPNSTRSVGQPTGRPRRFVRLPPGLQTGLVPFRSRRLTPISDSGGGVVPAPAGPPGPGLTRSGVGLGGRAPETAGLDHPQHVRALQCRGAAVSLALVQCGIRIHSTLVAPPHCIASGRGCRRPGRPGRQGPALEGGRLTRTRVEPAHDAAT